MDKQYVVKRDSDNPTNPWLTLSPWSWQYFGLRYATKFSREQAEFTAGHFYADYGQKAYAEEATEQDANLVLNKFTGIFVRSANQIIFERSQK